MYRAILHINIGYKLRFNHKDKIHFCGVIIKSEGHRYCISKFSTICDYINNEHICALLFLTNSQKWKNQGEPRQWPDPSHVCLPYHHPINVWVLVWVSTNRPTFCQVDLLCLSTPLIIYFYNWIAIYIPAHCQKMHTHNRAYYVHNVWISNYCILKTIWIKDIYT